MALKQRMNSMLASILIWISITLSLSRTIFDNSADRLAVKGQYLAFSFVNRHMIETLPEPFRNGIKRSNLWRDEDEGGGLAVSNCLSIYLPETGGEDAFFVTRMSYEDGFNIFNLLGFGESVIVPQRNIE